MPQQLISRLLKAVPAEAIVVRSVLDEKGVGFTVIGPLRFNDDIGTIGICKRAAVDYLTRRPGLHGEARVVFGHAVMQFFIFNQVLVANFLGVSA